MRHLLTVLISGLVLLAACGDDETPVAATDDDPSASSTEPRGGGVAVEGPKEYRSVSVTEHGEPRDLVEGTVISLRLGPDTIGASLGCNSISGDHAIEGDTLVVDGLAMTEMGCPGPRMEQDRWFADLLRSRPRLTVDGDTLLLASETATVTFRERSVVEPDHPLEGPEWVVTGFIDGELAMTLDPGSAPGTLRFDPSTGTATGFDGCNAVSVAYAVDDDRLRFGDLSADDAVCEGSDEYERRFRAVLDGAVEWDVSADRLVITTGDARGVTYRAAR